jgi:uncharacterized membrane protein
MKSIDPKDLAQITGGSAAPKKNFMPTESQKLTGIVVTGAMAGAVRGAAGGPWGMATGALTGASIGIGGYAVNRYANAGNRNAIPQTPKTPAMTLWSCHGNGPVKK